MEQITGKYHPQETDVNYYRLYGKNAKNIQYHGKLQLKKKKIVIGSEETTRKQAKQKVIFSNGRGHEIGKQRWEGPSAVYMNTIIAYKEVDYGEVSRNSLIVQTF